MVKYWIKDFKVTTIIFLLICNTRWLLHCAEYAIQCILSPGILRYSYMILRYNFFNLWNIVRQLHPTKFWNENVYSFCYCVHTSLYSFFICQYILFVIIENTLSDTDSLYCQYLIFPIVSEGTYSVLFLLRHHSLCYHDACLSIKSSWNLNKYTLQSLYVSFCEKIQIESAANILQTNQSWALICQHYI